MSREWLQQGERGSPFALKLIAWIALHLGRFTARVLLVPITLYFYLSSGRARLASRRFLSRARGRKASAFDVFLHLFHFATTILDRVYLLVGRHDQFDVRYFGVDELLDRVRRGQGCLLVGSHLGSFEILRTLAIDKDRAPLKVLMYKQHNQVVTQLLDALNPQVAASVIDLARPDCLLQAKDWVDEGGLVALLGDRVAGNGKTVTCEFLGREAVFPAGPALLAATLKVPVLLIFGLYRGGRRYDVHIELCSEQVQLDRRTRDAELQRLTQSYVSRLEHYARLTPYNWFNFYDFWNENSKSA